MVIAMREILFKAKTVKHREWVDGSLVVLDEEHMYIVPRYENASTLPISAIIGYSAICVDPETVCQYAGVTDKHGKKAFDGDIIKATAIGICNEDIEATVTIRLDDYELMWNVEHSVEIEIIGNIYDTTELVKEGV